VRISSKYRAEFGWRQSALADYLAMVDSVESVFLISCRG
jgi:hypothetical protein